MLDKRTYKLCEMQAYLGTERLDCIKSKLKTIECEYTTTGRGEERTFTVTKLPNRFKEMCIYELGFKPQTDFEKLKDFLYNYFFTDGFMTLPIQEMENVLRDAGTPVSRQTFKDWIKQLEKEELMLLDTDDCEYYSCYHDKNKQYRVKKITETEYKNAWKEFFRRREDKRSTEKSLAKHMRKQIGGKAVKCPKPKANAIHYDKLRELMQLVCE